MRDLAEDGACERAEDSRMERHGRAAVARMLEEYDAQADVEGASQRRFASEAGVARTTLQHWLGRRASLDASPAAVTFFESPDGVSFLHAFVVAAHLVMTWMGPCGIRLVGLLIELSGLGPFVASSYGSQQRFSAKMQAALVEYGDEERARLAAGMERKAITVCEDETFLSEDICLVAMEPVSGFILAEEYTEKRDAATWDAALDAATRNLQVEVIQSTADEAAALVRHAKNQGAEHSPDLFHVQHEVVKAMALSLAAHEERARAIHKHAAAEVKRHVEAERAYWEGPRGPGRPPGFARRIALARETEKEAGRQLEAAKEFRRRWREANRGIERAYHPFDLATSAPRSADLVGVELRRRFDELDDIAEEAALGGAGKRHLAKARRVVPKMVATMKFFHDETRRRVEAQGLPVKQE